MAGKPAEPPHPGQRPAGEEPLATSASSARRTRADEREVEHTGPVAIERYVKDDGRALILYSYERRAEDPPPRA
jgi:hypothetical protein